MMPRKGTLSHALSRLLLVIIISCDDINMHNDHGEFSSTTSSDTDKDDY